MSLQKEKFKNKMPIYSQLVFSASVGQENRQLWQKLPSYLQTSVQVPNNKEHVSFSLANHLLPSLHVCKLLAQVIWHSSTHQVSMIQI